VCRIPFSSCCQGGRLPPQFLAALRATDLTHLPPPTDPAEALRRAKAPTPMGNGDDACTGFAFQHKAAGRKHGQHLAGSCAGTGAACAAGAAATGPRQLPGPAAGVGLPAGWAAGAAQAVLCLVALAAVAVLLGRCHDGSMPQHKWLAGAIAKRRAQ
jgi:hypothetical protein